MINSETAIDIRIDEVARQLHALEARVADLTLQVKALQAPRELPETVPDEPAASERPSLWSGTPVLPAIAAVCFLLVIALILRTLVDSGVANPSLGLGLGAAYAGLLVLIGYYRHAQMLRLGSVLASCGFLLFYSILIEGHARFGILSAPVAYAGLVAGLGAAAIPRRHRVPIAALCIGILGAAVAGIALEFPHPHLPYLAALLFLANIAAYHARAAHRSAWLKWAVLGLTVFFWFLWVVRVRTWNAGTGEATADPALDWLIPCLAAYTLLYVLTALYALRSEGAFHRFEALLPTIAAIGGYAVAQAALAPAWSAYQPTAVAGVVSAAAFLLLGVRLASRPRPRMRAAAAFVLPGAAMLVVSLPGAVAKPLAYTAAAATGLLIALASIHWRSRPIRACSYALQAYACGAAVVAGALAIQSPLPIGHLALAMALGVLGCAHYAVCRHWKARHDGTCFDSADPRDRAALLCVLASVAAFFAFGRILLFALLGAPDDDSASFQCAESVVLSLGAVALATVGLGLASGELLLMALVVALAAAAKVFAYDLFTIRGLPLVASVFSVGLTAAFGSIAWARWQRFRP